MIRIAVALLSAGVCVAAPGVKEREPVLYFPIQEGATWVWEVRSGEGKTESSETVIKVESKDGKHTVTVDRGRDGVRVTGHYEVSDRGLARVGGKGREAARVAVLLKLPAKPGDAWTIDLPGKEGKVTCTVGAEEDVTVPAGKFRAIPVTTEFDLGTEKEKGTTWYAPGIGPVKIQTEGREGRVLKSFTPGK
jgi:hypothetical protein